MIRYRVLVTNEGIAPATGVPVRLAVDGDGRGHASPSRAGPAQRIVSAITGPACSGSVKAAADPDGVIVESSEADNAQGRLRRSAAGPTAGAARRYHRCSERLPSTPDPDHLREATKDAPIGGQAVLEGVMMRGISTWAVAVRKPSRGAARRRRPRLEGGRDGEIEVVSEPLVSWTKRHRLLRLPVVRGVVALAESLKIGFRALGISANAQVPPDEDGEQQEIGGGAWAGTIVFALLFAVGLFFLLPAGLTNLFSDSIPTGSCSC